MKRQLTLLAGVFLLFLGSPTPAQPGLPRITGKTTKTEDPRLAILRQHALALKSIDPAATDFTDLAPLKKVIGSARIVQLGEQSHGDGATFHAKTRLIKFLHQEMGFSVLAIESGLYDCRKAWQFYLAGQDPLLAAKQGIFGIWAESNEFRPLVDYLGAGAKTKAPLTLAGFDCQLTGIAASTTLKDDLHEFVAANTPPTEQCWNLVGQTIDRLISGDTSTLGMGPKANIMAAFAELQQSLDPSGIKSPTRARETLFWHHYLTSLPVYAQILWAKSQANKMTLAARFNPRDAQMGKNLIWLAEKWFPKRKIIVWAATMHILREAQLIKSKRINYGGIKTAGHHLSQHLGKDVFTIGFTAYEGRAGAWFQRSRPLHKPATGEFEDLCVRAGLQNAFIGFRGKAKKTWLGQEFIARPLGYSPMSAPWGRTMDGMVFTRTMYPSTGNLPGRKSPKKLKK